MKIVKSQLATDRVIIRYLDGPKSSKSVDIFHHPRSGFLRVSVNPQEGWSEDDWDGFSSFPEILGMQKADFMRLLGYAMAGNKPGILREIEKFGL